MAYSELETIIYKSESVIVCALKYVLRSLSRNLFVFYCRMEFYFKYSGNKRKWKEYIMKTRLCFRYAYGSPDWD